jgi:hypothetical protein
LPDRILSGGDGENRAEHGPDAGRPAESEGKADDISAEEPGRPRVGVIARLAMQDGNVDDAQKVQPGDDDDDSRDLAEQGKVSRDELARGTGGRAEDHEHRGEAEHEGD